MNTIYPVLYRWLRVATLAAMAAGLLVPEALAMVADPLALILILAAGVPHGATDHLIFRHLVPGHGTPRQQVLFYARYVGGICLYALIWWQVPLVALAIFLLVSAYHFGQSNWSFLELGKVTGTALYLSWGGLIIALPVLAHPESSRPILEAMLQRPIEGLPSGQWAFAGWALALANAGMLGALAMTRKLSARQAGVECVHLLLLAAMFSTTPMLLGFAIYFAGWHSLTSMSDQQAFFRAKIPGYGWRDQIKAALPYTLVALSGLAGLWWFQHPHVREVSWGTVFLFISLITLPHMLLIEDMMDSGPKAPEEASQL